MIEWYDLNNRHIASIIWLVIVVIGVCFIKNIRSSGRGVVRAALHRQVLGILVEMLIYCVVLFAGVVLVGRHVGLWTTLPVVAALFWYVLSGLSLLGLIATPKPGAYRRKLKATLGLTAIVVALLEVSVFPLLFELFFIPLSIFLASSLVWAQSEGDSYKGARILLTVMLMCLNLSSIGFSVITGRLHAVAVLEAFILPILLTLGLFPYLRYVPFMERFEYSKNPVFRKKVTATDYGDSWPFTLDTVRLCYQAHAVWVEERRIFPWPRIKRYPVNGSAHIWLKRRGYKYRDLKEIWTQLPDGSRVSIYSIIQDGLAMGEPAAIID